MKRFFVFFALLSSFQGILKAQDIAPGQEAQGYLESRNVVVDYSAGLFHYRVPVYTFKSGDFQLPVSMDYVSSSIKRGSNPGLLDYNWNLNVGGIVTRTIRGGVADEAENGILNKPLLSFGINETIKDVNGRKRDGETDIFTAVFNGRSVDFILKLVDNKIIAVPLEHSNVRIACDVSSSPKEIHGWVITDEDGNRYVYYQQAWTEGIVKEGAVSFNGIRGKSYPSSWYLIRIEPRNGEPVVYTYQKDVNSPRQKYKVNAETYYNVYDVTYHYGKPMVKYPFDYEKYRKEFEGNIDYAMKQFNSSIIMKDLLSSITSFSQYGSMLIYPEYERMPPNYETHCRIMSQLASFKEITEPSSYIITYLERLIDYYNRSGGATMGILALQSAKETMAYCLRERTSVQIQESSNLSGQRVCLPVLTKIQCEDKVITLDYVKKIYGLGNNKVAEVMCLNSMAVSNMLDELIIKVSIPRGAGCRMEQISFFDKDEVEVKRIRFRKDIGELVNRIFENGGETTIDYEPCTCVDKNMPDRIISMKDCWRLKSIVFKDPMAARPDSIIYNYPYPGTLVYNDRLDKEIVSYDGFNDTVTYSMAINKGNAFYRTGNAGVYYNYVEEHFAGRGTKTYLFYTPCRYPNQVTPEDIHNSYAFWLNGVLLATAVYDDSGNLRRLTRNSYYTDLKTKEVNCPYFYLPAQVREIFNPEKWFVQCNNAYEYNDSLLQIKGFEYYMDYEKVTGQQYLQEQLVKAAGMDIYYDVRLLFEVNYIPRTTVRVLEGRWYLRYGGKTLLKGQDEYHFEGNEFHGPSILHLGNMDTYRPFVHMEYAYDNTANLSAPTRISETDAMGNCITTAIKRVPEMADGADPVIARMKTANLLNPVIKQQKWLKKAGSGDEVLLEELVYRYNEKEVKGKYYIGLMSTYLYRPSDLLAAPAFTIPDSYGFTYAQSSYFLQETKYYGQRNNSYFPVESVTRQDNSVFYYNLRGDIIMRLVNGKSYSSSVADLRSIYNRNKIYSCSEDTNTFYNHIKNLYIKVMEVDHSYLPSLYKTYVESQSYKLVINLLERLMDFGARPNLEGMNTLIYNINNDYTRPTFREYCNYCVDIPGESVSALEAFVHGSVQYIDSHLQLLPPIPKEDIYLRKYDFCVDREYLMTKPDTLRLTSYNPPKQMKLFIFSKKTVSKISCVVYSSSGTSVVLKDVPDCNFPAWKLKTVDIDLSSFGSVASIVIKPVTTWAYAALIPADAVFEAISYNPDGTVFCRFDQNGQLERYEYDGAGRLTRVYDQDGKLIRAFEYNIVIQ